MLKQCDRIMNRCGRYKAAQKALNFYLCIGHEIMRCFITLSLLLSKWILNPFCYRSDLRSGSCKNLCGAAWSHLNWSSDSYSYWRKLCSKVYWRLRRMLLMSACGYPNKLLAQWWVTCRRWWSWRVGVTFDISYPVDAFYSVFSTRSTLK